MRALKLIAGHVIDNRAYTYNSNWKPHGITTVYKDYGTSLQIIDIRLPLTFPRCEIKSILIN